MLVSFERFWSASLTEGQLVAAGFNGMIFLFNSVESTHLVLANLQRAHVASVMSVHMLAPR